MWSLPFFFFTAEFKRRHYEMFFMKGTLQDKLFLEINNSDI